MPMLYIYAVTCSPLRWLFEIIRQAHVHSPASPKGELLTRGFESRRATLAGRLLAHLNVIPSCRFRCAVFHGAIEIRTIHRLTCLQKIADASALKIWRNAGCILKHIL